MRLHIYACIDCTRIESVSFPTAQLTSNILTIEVLNTVNKKYTIYFTRFLTITNRKLFKN